jgi:hypothetical protein
LIAVPELSNSETFDQNLQKERRLFFAAVWGVIMGCLTFAAGPLTSFSANPIIAAIQFIFTMLLIPGLFCAAMVGSLGPAALVNALFHFGIIWLLLALIARLRGKAKVRH